MKSRRTGRGPALRAVLASACLLAVAACGNGDGGGTTSAPAPQVTHTTTPSQPMARTVQVSETDFALKLSEAAFSPGDYTFEVKNDGKVTHALAISGPGVATTQTGVLAPGGTEKLTVTLREGEYELWCPVGNHRGLGMTTRIKVGPGGGTAPSTP